MRDAWLPLLEPLGFRAQLTLERHGFMPQGGGVIRARIAPRRPGAALELLERGALQRCSARVLLSRLPEEIGRREAATLRGRLGLPEDACRIETVTASGPGNALHVRVDCAHLTTLFVGFGARGVPAETVAGRVADEVQRYLDADVAVDPHLADQLLLPLALGAGGCFSTLAPSGHTVTNAAVIGLFLPAVYEAREFAPGRWALAMRRAAGAAQSAVRRAPRTK